ncbi:hypothetical protein FJT64_017549 [Amphibalanus amphitrite]|uniref:Apple domain-containing protein n=1 Tax=Amphibalanus amphitrite TaxID=1232801 RepID=A0A6A4WX84_AMPAM|nr:hypothetical protein FJT64_017549 [Amphibalanus amphitrite]
MCSAAASLLLLTSAALGAERFDRQQDLQPVSWIHQVPAPSLVSCSARCAAHPSCGQLSWESTDRLCRLAESTADGGQPPSDAPQLTLYRPAAAAATTPPSSTSAATTPPSSTAVDGRYYWHATSTTVLSYDDARTHCQDLMSGGDLASLHTQAQLDFLWADTARPMSIEFIGVTYRDVNGERRARNPDDTDLAFDITGYITGSSGSRLVLPSNRGTGQLLRMSHSGTRLTNMVCDSLTAPPSDVVATPP